MNGEERADTHVALLRGVNVGGRNKLPMKALASMFRNIGCDSVQTYIQSGNVVFRADTELACRVPGLIAESIASEFGYTITLVGRSAVDLYEAVRVNPFARDGADVKELHAVFVADDPPSELVDALDPGHSPGDRFSVVGREIFLHCPRGLSRTKFTNAWFDSKLQTTSTMRNWRTVLKLLELTAA